MSGNKRTRININYNFAVNGYRGRGGRADDGDDGQGGAGGLGVVCWALGLTNGVVGLQNAIQ